jgi:uncharacterized protein YqhQ
LERKCTSVGGQAVIEGVMMRGPGSLAIAVRRPDGAIALKEAPWRSIWNRLRFLRWPFLRGTVVMVEAMINGMQALGFSAREATPEAERAKAGQGGGGAMALPMLLSLVVAVGLFKLLPHLAATHLGTLLGGGPLTVDEVLYHVVDGVVKIAIFVGYVAAIGLLADIRRVFMYHGAEHQAIHTHEAGAALTVENARGKSPLHPRCGTAFLMVVILIFILVAAAAMPFAPEWAKPGAGKPWFTHLLLVLLKLPLLLPVAGLAYEFNRFAGRHVDSPWLRPLLWPGLAMQLLTTRKPTDDQLEIALVSLRTALWREAAGQEARTGADGEDPLVFESFAAFETGLAALEAAAPEAGA